MTLEIGPETTIRRSPRAVSRLIAGETLVFDLGSDRFYSLDSVGTRVWELIAEPSLFRDLVGTMLAEFEVGEDRVSADLQRLFQDLAEKGLVRFDGPTR